MSKKTPDYDFEQKTYGTSIWGRLLSACSETRQP